MASENHWSKQKQTTEIIPMAATATVIEGIVNFSNVTQHDVYNGQSTGAYSMTITIDEEDAAFLASQGPL